MNKHVCAGPAHHQARGLRLRLRVAAAAAVRQLGGHAHLHGGAGQSHRRRRRALDALQLLLRTGGNRQLTAAAVDQAPVQAVTRGRRATARYLREWWMWWWKRFGLAVRWVMVVVDLCWMMFRYILCSCLLVFVVLLGSGEKKDTYGTHLLLANSKQWTMIMVCKTGSNVGGWWLFVCVWVCVCAQL